MFLEVKLFGEEGQIRRLGLTHTTIYKIDNQQRPTYSTGNSTQYSVLTCMEKGSEKKKYIYIYITNSLCCMLETNTTLLMKPAPT